MPTPTTAQLIAAIEQRKAERRHARPDDRTVLDEELAALRLALLKVRWMEQSCQSANR